MNTASSFGVPRSRDPRLIWEARIQQGPTAQKPEAAVNCLSGATTKRI
jgi:hypothetical protein